MTAAEFLDELDAVRAKATPGEWVQHPSDGEYVIGDVSDGGESYLDVADTYSFSSRNSGYADAACIVAEHNALPKLTAAVRAVEALTYASDDGSEWEHNPGCDGEPECPACWAQGIRGVLADALAGDS